MKDDFDNGGNTTEQEPNDLFPALRQHTNFSIQAGW